MKRTRALCLLLILLLILTCLPSLFLGCAPKPELLGVVYVPNDFSPYEPTHEVHETIEAYGEEHGIDVFRRAVDVQAAADVRYATASLYEGKYVPEKIVFVDEEAEDEENPVVTSKWLYYAALMEYWRGNSFARKNEENELAVFSSAPCMEQIALYPALFDGDPAAEPTILYARQAQAAALAYYGLVDYDEIPHGIVSFTVYAYQNGYLSPVTYRIVGYFETEADRLLGTGVPLGSPAYEIVVKQLQNPVLYAAPSDDRATVRYGS